MKTLKLKSVTFYQSVRLDGVEYNTVLLSDAKCRRSQIIFCEDKIFIRNPDWKNAYSKDTVSIIGLHNVRHAVVDKEDFIESEFKDIFKGFKTVEDKVKIIPTNPVIPELKTDMTYAQLGHSPVDDSTFTALEDEDKKILLKQELKRFKIDFDNRQGITKLLERFNEGRDELISANS